MSGVLQALMATPNQIFSAGSGGSYSDNDPSETGGASVTLTLNTNGTATITNGAGTLASWNWITPTFYAASAYQNKARVTVTSGAFTDGDSTGSDVALSSQRSWSVTSLGSAASVSFKLELKNAGGNLGQGVSGAATANYTFAADAA